MKSLHYLLIVLAFLLQTGHAQNYTDSLTMALEQLYHQSDLPGFGAAIVSTDRILYQYGFGYADIQSKIPYSPETMQNIGSITKTFLGLAIMQAVDKGLLSLDLKVNDVLPFNVIHPHFPDIPITLKHLVTHTSGIQDSYWDLAKATIMEEKFPLKRKKLPEGYYRHAVVYNKNSRMPLSDYLYNILDTQGKWYNVELSFLKEAPGTTYKYSNIGTALAGYILEIVTGKSFEEYAQEEIFGPLGMDKTGWDHSPNPQHDYATLYFPNGMIVPEYSLIIYPAGSILSSTQDLCLYVMEMLRGYEGKGTLLSEAAYREMFTVQFEGGDRPGIFWDIGKKTINHNGSHQGYYALVAFDKELKIGKILLTNTSASWVGELEEQFYAIWRTMYAYQGLLGN